MANHQFRQNFGLISEILGGIWWCFSNPEIFIFIAFFRDNFCRGEPPQAKFFRKFSKFSKIFEKILRDETSSSQKHFFGQTLVKLCPFLAKKAVFWLKTPVFFKISAPSAPKFDFCQPTSVAEEWNRHPLPFGPASPLRIPLILI